MQLSIHKVIVQGQNKTLALPPQSNGKSCPINHLGSVWMSILEALILNWVQYQISLHIEMGSILKGCLDAGAIARWN
jgi:hypothetical protein